MLISDEKSELPPTAQTYPSSLLTTATGSRLFESILAVAPERIFKALWELYFVGKIGKFAGHPFANFVTAKGVSRLDAEGVEQVIKECKSVAGGRGLISKLSSHRCRVKPTRRNRANERLTRLGREGHCHSFYTKPSPYSE